MKYNQHRKDMPLRVSSMNPWTCSKMNINSGDKEVWHSQRRSNFIAERQNVFNFNLQRTNEMSWVCTSFAFVCLAFTDSHKTKFQMLYDRTISGTLLQSKDNAECNYQRALLSYRYDKYPNINNIDLFPSWFSGDLSSFHLNWVLLRWIIKS